jgi:anaerobic magnesium-protoporphyrin IX monomethyl ester cyclase
MTADAETRLRVLLVYPPSRTQSHTTCPMALLMLGAVLDREGHEVRLLDANALDRRLTSEEVAALAAEFRPDVIGVTILTPLAREAYRLASLLRGQGARLLAGGPHATLVPDESLAHGFDAVVVGEGEPVIGAAVRALAGGLPMTDVPGWHYRGTDGALRETPPCPPPSDLDALPLPAYHLVDHSKYQSPKAGLNVFSSRGCTARCTYCAGGLFGKKFRFRSAQNVLAELSELYGRYGTRHFHFVDDAMSLDKERMREICQGIVEARLPITWSMMTRIDGVDEELLRLAMSSGCTQIDYGVESGSKATLRKIRKPQTPEMIRRAISLTASLGIKPNVFFILGFPWEDVEAIEETRAMMEYLIPYVSTFHPAVGTVLIPFPGTEIYEQYKDRYGFQDWWLGEDRNYDVPRLGSHAYFEYVVFRCGAILDADFFHYVPEVKWKIIDLFTLMYFQNLRSRGFLSRVVQKGAFSLSVALARRWPRAERLVFGLLGKAAEQARVRQQARDREALLKPVVVREGQGVLAS